jgi:hypothetical protein
MPRDYYAEMSPQAKNREQFDRMVTFFRRADTEDDLKKCVMMFVMDMSYQRSDIMLALGIVEREKGWHR